VQIERVSTLPAHNTSPRWSIHLAKPMAPIKITLLRTAGINSGLADSILTHPILVLNRLFSAVLFRMQLLYIQSGRYTLERKPGCIHMDTLIKWLKFYGIVIVLYTTNQFKHRITSSSLLTTL